MARFLGLCLALGTWSCPRNENTKQPATEHSDQRQMHMVYRGVVKNGVVVLGGGTRLPEGTEVQVQPVTRAEEIAGQGPTLLEQLSDVVGSVPELPTDMAQQHDHYLHGAPKR